MVILRVPHTPLRARMRISRDTGTRKEDHFPRLRQDIRLQVTPQVPQASLATKLSKARSVLHAVLRILLERECADVALSL